VTFGRDTCETSADFIQLLTGGDFFFDPPASNLTYSGIYRYLNNPERVLGLAGVWGVAFITWNVPMFYLAAIAHILALSFLQFVERPHMTKYVLKALPKCLCASWSSSLNCWDYNDHDNIAYSFRLADALHMTLLINQD
jgi:hypothetical protein